MFLKGELGPIFRPIEAVVGAEARRHGSGFLRRRRSSRIDLESATIFASKRALIAPRSGYDRVSIVPSILDQMSSDEVEDRRLRFRDSRAPLWR